MAKLPLQFNTTQNSQGLDDYTPMPAGDYLCAISKSEYKVTKAKTGHYLQLIYKVLAGKFKGRTIFVNLNLDNPNAIAVEIANKALNSICQACQKVGVEDSAELHAIPHVLTLKVKAATSSNPASNEVTAYKPNTGEHVEMPVPTDATGEAPSSGAAPQTGGETVKKKLPWE